jgi:hypothetical protein
MKPSFHAAAGAQCPAASGSGMISVRAFVASGAGRLVIFRTREALFDGFVAR